MRSAFLVALIAACSSSPGPQRGAPLPAPTAMTARTEEPAPTAVPPLAAAASGAPAPRCVRSVWPYFDPSGEVSGDATDVRAGDDDGGDDDGGDDGGGATLDDKLAELNARRPSDGVCDTRHRDELEHALLAGRAPLPAARGPAAWDRRTPPRHRELVRSTLALTAAEEATLARHGFVVPARLAYPDYTTAYHDIHRGQLPVFVSVDSILHAIYASHDHLIARLEEGALARRLDELLGALHCGLVTVAPSYPAEVAQDLDLYLTVARSLLAAEPVPPVIAAANATAAGALIALLDEAAGIHTVTLFGRARALDATQFAPRGHYDDGGSLARYFRAAMWLSRVEFNLVSRDSRSSQPGYDADPRETPREAVVALALAELARSAGVLDDLAALDQAWTAFAGRREDLTLHALLALRDQAGITRLEGAQTAARLRAAIGEGGQRTVNTHPMPSVKHLPAIATLLGPRLTPDQAALGVLVDERGPELRGVELGYVLGHDRARAHLPAEPALMARLQAARATLAAAPASADLYSAWLAAIRALAERPRGATPSFMDGTAFADLRLDSAIAAYGQLRHNHVLIQAQLYDQGGCEIPDGYVEPAPATYRALAAYAARGRRVFAALDPADASRGAAYFTRLERLMQVLEALSHEQLANRPLSATARRFLAMIVERREATARGYMTTFPVATYDGWYIDLFPQLELSFRDAGFVADYATYDRDGRQGIHYLGAKGPQLGVFVVDTGGPPRLMVGPVARAFEFHGPLDARLTDDAAASVPGLAPWAASYTVAAPPAPGLTVRYHRAGARPTTGGGPRPTEPTATALPPNTVLLEAQDALGEVTIDFLDHHFVTMRTVRTRLDAGASSVKAPSTRRPIEALRIRVGAFTGRVVLGLDGRGHEVFGAPPAGAEDAAR